MQTGTCNIFCGIEEEIETLRNDLKITRAAVRQMTLSASAGTRKGRPRDAAERKAQAQRMREIGAARRAAHVAVNSASLKIAPSASAKVKTSAQRKAISLAMKEGLEKEEGCGCKEGFQIAFRENSQPRLSFLAIGRRRAFLGTSSRFVCTLPSLKVT